MNGKNHRLVTSWAFDVIARPESTSVLKSRAHVISHVAGIGDYLKDLTLFDGDDYHQVDPDRGEDYTKYNHFIDIKKRPGIFDDYDGYSYERGSASKEQYESALHRAQGLVENAAALLSGKMVDEAVAGYWLNDEQVVYSRPCPAKYSFPEEMGRYKRRLSELTARFPHAHRKGKSGHGVPFSVFMPIDNLARYWYERFLRLQDPRALGLVMHAIQDASVPHHAAGYCGNFHVDWENKLEELSLKTKKRRIIKKARALLARWLRADDHRPPLPRILKPGDEKKLLPSVNWRIDYLVTYMALRAYHVYDAYMKKYFEALAYPILPPVPRPCTQPSDSAEYWAAEEEFEKFNARLLKQAKRILQELEELLVYATAMSALVLEKAQQDCPIPFWANPISRRVHAPDCVKRLHADSTVLIRFDTLENAKAAGYKRCLLCLKPAPYKDQIGNYVGNYESHELHELSCTHFHPPHIGGYSTIADALDKGYNGCYWCLRARDERYVRSYVPKWEDDPEEMNLSKRRTIVDRYK